MIDKTTKLDEMELAILEEVQRTWALLFSECQNIEEYSKCYSEIPYDGLDNLLSRTTLTTGTILELLKKLNENIRGRNE